MPKIINHDEQRLKMLEKCLYLFTRKGYSDVNMKQIAAEIGVSTGSLYHYFSSKESILAGIIAWSGQSSVNEYIERTSSVENISDRFDMIVDFWKEKRELYKNIMLFAMNVYRNVDSGKWKAAYSFFSEAFISCMSERLNISRQFARSIFIHFVGLSFHSTAFDGNRECNQEIDFLDKILRPTIVEAHDDIDKAADKFKEITRTILMNKFAHPETTSFKKNKTIKTKKAITERKHGRLKKQRKNSR
jgi:AcrR family transcriptional regulator